MRARLARWYAGTTWKLAGQSYELEGRVAETMKAYAECVRINPDDVVTQKRLALLRRVYASSEPAGCAEMNEGRQVTQARESRFRAACAQQPLPLI